MGESWFRIDPDSDWFCISTVNGNTICGDPLEDGVWAIAINEINTNIIFAGTAFSGNVLKSTDGGMNWEMTSLQNIAPKSIECTKDTSIIYVCSGYTDGYALRHK